MAISLAHEGNTLVPFHHKTCGMENSAPVLQARHHVAPPPHRRRVQNAKHATGLAAQSGLASRFTRSEFEDFNVYRLARRAHRLKRCYQPIAYEAQIRTEQRLGGWLP